MFCNFFVVSTVITKVQSFDRSYFIAFEYFIYEKVIDNNTIFVSGKKYRVRVEQFSHRLIS